MSRKHRRSLWFYVIIATIGIIALGSAILRHEQRSVEGASPLAVLASTALLTLVLLGPSIIGKNLLVTLLPIQAKVREQKRLRRAIRENDRRVRRAEERLAQLALHEQWWVQEAETIRAGYNLAYVEFGGTIQTNPYIAEFPRKVS